MSKGLCKCGKSVPKKKKSVKIGRVLNKELALMSNNRKKTRHSRLSLFPTFGLNFINTGLREVNS